MKNEINPLLHDGREEVVTNVPYLTSRCALVCLDASACCDAGCGEPEGPGTSAGGRGTDPGCQGRCRTRSHVSYTMRPRLTCVSVQVVLRPPLDVYDVLIHLHPKQVPLLSQAVDPPAFSFSRGVLSGAVSPAGGALPVIDYNPASLYLAELRVSPIY